MSKKELNKGITLIALVITIIVLLILAGVTITTLTGDNGILTKATEAKEETRAGTVEEAKELWEINKQDGSTTQTLDEFLSNLKKQNLLTDKELEIIKETGEVKIGKRVIIFRLTLVEMYDKAVADGCINENGTCQNKEHLHIGDYVDYRNPTTGSRRANAVDTGYESDQIYEASNNQLNWRVLGKDETTGGIKLISGRPMKSNNGEDDPYLYLYGAKGYLNSETILNNLCSLYTTQYGTARSVNIDDINEITGVTTEEKIKEVNKATIWWGDIQYNDPYNIENQYTPQSWLNGKYKTTVSGIVDNYVYTINSGEEPEIKITNTRVYDILFDNIDKASYWLASRCVLASSDVAQFAVRDIAMRKDTARVASFGLFSSTNDIEKENIRRSTSCDSTKI